MGIPAGCVLSDEAVRAVAPVGHTTLDGADEEAADPVPAMVRMNRHVRLAFPDHGVSDDGVVDLDHARVLGEVDVRVSPSPPHDLFVAVGSTDIGPVDGEEEIEEAVEVGGFCGSEPKFTRHLVRVAAPEPA
jgi:hypothetical protein